MFCLCKIKGMSTKNGENRNTIYICLIGILYIVYPNILHKGQFWPDEQKFTIVSLSICLSFCLSVCLSFYLSVYLFVYLSFCLSFLLSVLQFVSLSICLSHNLFVSLSICLTILLSVLSPFIKLIAPSQKSFHVLFVLNMKASIYP